MTTPDIQPHPLDPLAVFPEDVYQNGGSNPHGWAAFRGASWRIQRRTHEVIEWTRIPDDHPSQEQQR